MFWDVYPLRRDGSPVPNWQRASLCRRGKVVVSEAHDAALNRAVKVAVLQPAPPEPGTDPKGLPELRDVVLVHTDGRRWTLTGYEAITRLGAAAPVHFQQSWLLVPIDERDREVASGRAYVESMRAHRENFIGPPEPEGHRAALIQQQRRHRRRR